MNQNTSTCYVHDWYLQYPNGPYWIVPDFQYPYNPPLVSPQPLKVWSSFGITPTFSSIEYPEVNIMVNNNRVRKVPCEGTIADKHDKVYLNEGEFAIEMFNKSAVTLGAKIKLNGKYISTSHLILYPGQRLVLDRYLDTKDKLKFTVYSVDNNTTVDQIIKDNGQLEVEFYQEYIEPQKFTLYNANSSVNTINPTTGVANPTTSTNFYFNSGGAGTTLNSSSIMPFTKSTKLGAKETGLVEKGSRSEQDLTYVNKTFNAWTLTTVKFKLLPVSEKPVEAKDLVNYCTNCGQKTNRSHRFCSNCGTKI